jgi:Ca2+-binding RTX toxin-like protein
MMRKYSLPSMVAFGIVAFTEFGVPSAAALVSSTVDQGVLTITSDADPDALVVGCRDNEVTVNGQDPDSGAAACADITSIVVSAGEGDDTVDLHRVSSDPFTGLDTVSIDAGDGDDWITGSKVPDTISAGAGRDVVEAEPSGGDFLDGGAGFDQARLSTSTDLTISDDEIIGASGTVAFTSFADAIIHGSAGDEEIDAHAFSGRWLTVVGRGGNDRLIGSSSGPSLLSGGGGDDVLVGGPKHDDLYGGAGDDVVIGKGGEDYLPDERGADRVSGGAGRDDFSLYLGIRGQRGNVFRGGPGADHLTVDLLGRSARLTNRSFVARGAGARLRSIEGAQLYVASSEPVRIDATGFSGDLSVGEPGSGDDVILGGSGNDGLFGGDGDDVISGGPGRDHLDGGRGTDSCDGGPGRDEVVACE